MNKTRHKEKYFFILNGPDLEMDEVVKVLDKEKINWIMPYQQRSQKTIKPGDLKKFKNDKRIRVYVECFPEKRIARRNDIYIDHHNEFIRRRGALIQVKRLLSQAITRRDLWIEAYDKAGVWGALKTGAPKKLVNQWINIGLKRNNIKQGRQHWTRVINQSPVIDGLKIIRIKIGNQIQSPRMTALVQIYDFLNYPKKKNLLIVASDNRQIIKYYFFCEPKISSKLYKKFGGYIFGDIKLQNISWGINNNWKIPKEEEVLRVVMGK